MSVLLREYLRTPTLHEETEQLLWCDPDVSLQLLAAHLDADNPMASRPPHSIEASAEPHVCLRKRSNYRNHALLDRYIVKPNSRVKVYNIWTTCFGLESLAQEATNADFAVIFIIGSIAGNAFDPPATPSAPS